MSTDMLRWSDDAVVSTHDWGVLVHDERGVHQLRGSGLERPVTWLRQRLAEPTDPQTLLAPLPQANRAHVRRLVDSLVARGAITVDRTDEATTRTLRCELRAGTAAAPTARALAGLLVRHDVVCDEPVAALAAGLAVVDGEVHADTSAHAVGFRLVLRGDDLWLGVFHGDAAARTAGALELARYLTEGDGARPAAADGADVWLPWVARTLVEAARTEAPDGDRCVRLGLGPFGVQEHRLVRVHGDRVHEEQVHEDRVHEDQVHEDQVHEEQVLVEKAHDGVDDLADPLVISRRCAHLVDDVTSPVGVPSEAGLRQLPLQLSRSVVRHADGSRHAVLGHGWTLEHARGHAVGEAVLRYATARLAPHVTAYPLTAQGTGPGAPVVLRRDDVLSATTAHRGAASLGACAQRAAHVAAVRLAAHLAATDPRVAWDTVPLPPATPGADLLAIHQECGEVLVARGLPFALVALHVAADTVVVGSSDHGDAAAAEAAVVQALLQHQSHSPGNATAAPRTYPAPAPPADGAVPATSLVDLLSRHGTPLVVHLSGGPSLDAALPHQALVLLAPGGTRP